MESRVIDEIRKEIGCGDTLSNDGIQRVFSNTFTESRISLGLAAKDLKGAIRDALPAWLARR